MKLSFRTCVRLLLPPAVGVIGGIFLLRRHPHSVLEVGLFLAFCLSWSIAAWMNNKILSEALQCFWWGALLVFSWKSDRSLGFGPLMCAGMLFFSVFVLYQALQEHRSHTQGS